MREREDRLKVTLAGQSVQWHSPYVEYDLILNKMCYNCLDLRYFYLFVGSTDWI